MSIENGVCKQSHLVGVPCHKQVATWVIIIDLVESVKGIGGYELSEPGFSGL